MSFSDTIFLKEHFGKSQASQGKETSHITPQVKKSAYTRIKAPVNGGMG